MKQIQLTQGKVAIVDDADYEWLNQWNWYAMKGKTTWYATRHSPPPSRKLIYMHRVILNAPDRLEGDHVDRNGLHNWRSNLRLATRTHNNINRRIKGGIDSGYKGVYWESRQRKWIAKIIVDGRPIYLGTFLSTVDAARAYDVAAREHFGEFASLNFPDE